MSTSPFDFLYDDRRELNAFGDKFCGPNRLPHNQEVLVAKYPKTSGDGQDVDVYCIAMPARFYKIRVQASRDSVGRTQEAFTLATGSGAHELVAHLATAVSGGMLGLE